jgi:hypothetical protein
VLIYFCLFAISGVLGFGALVNQCAYKLIRQSLFSISGLISICAGLQLTYSVALLDAFSLYGCVVQC